MQVLKRLTVAFLAVLACTLTSAAAGKPPPGSDPAVAEWPYWPYMVSACYGPPFNPVSMFSGPANAELGSTPAEIELRETIYDPELAWLGLPKDHWRRIFETDSEATFTSGRLSSYPQWTYFRNDGSGWKLTSSGGCPLYSRVLGRFAVTWDLTAKRTPGPNARWIKIHLGPGPCSSGAAQAKRMHSPVFRQLGRRLLMTIVLDPLPPGTYTCIGVREPSILVKLPGRLGNRSLYDGGTYPPRSRMEPVRSARLPQ